ncbi:hypothetical protein PHLGIDRAFT_20688 [Phlebiopsis gigantea 11061_1 CR5-6]|uniref:Uncharacterized protein n=1 Tax=Phlebiopsis gigantea (strain 11061_1 CR5-6) TaxID=745531 RepID=A0A0C3S1E8_PHLG1|nr:hypothetical protein PHLGIDRAFT_20688 [Phlebiopsis gigantea 11061_1 CR5-6]
MTDLDRSPSRMGFTRRRTSDYHYAEAVEDDDDKWELAGALLVPSNSTSSDGSNDSDDAEAEFNEHKPALPARTVSLINLPLYSPVAAQSTPAALSYEGVVMHNVDSPESTVVDHGLSRSALTHLKGFWSARQDEYARLEAQFALAEANAYDGIWQPRPRSGFRAALFNRLWNSDVQSSYDVETPRSVEPNVDAPIYPRTGDLATLRDSRPAALDRAFCHLPLNSINKILFLHDMLERSTTPSPVSPVSPLPKDSSSDDEDNVSFVDISLGSCASCESAFVGGETSFCSAHEHRNAARDDNHEQETDSVHPVDYDRVWEIDWTARWKVLFERVKEDPTSPVDEKAFRAVFNPPKPPKFFIGEEEEDDFFGADSEGEDEDYGVLVSQPSYGVSADSLSREFLHNLCNFRVGMGI